MHHSYVDKIFAQWQFQAGDQSRKQSFDENLGGRVLHPFDDPVHNEFHEVTGIGGLGTWDYRKNLGYEYDYLEGTNDRLQECVQVKLGKNQNGVLNWKLNCKEKRFKADRSRSRPGKNKTLTAENGAEIKQQFQIKDQDLKRQEVSVRPFVAVAVPKDFTGQLSFRYCSSNNDCEEGEIAVFGSDPKPLKKGTPVTAGNFKIKTELLLKNIFKNDTIPSEAPKVLRWEKITLEKKSMEVVPVKPFMVYELEFKQSDADIKIANLPKGANQKEYGDLLDGYKVLQYCDRIEVKKNINWNFGKNCK